MLQISTLREAIDLVESPSLKSLSTGFAGTYGERNNISDIIEASGKEDKRVKH